MTNNEDGFNPDNSQLDLAAASFDTDAVTLGEGANPEALVGEVLAEDDLDDGFDSAMKTAADYGLPEWDDEDESEDVLAQKFVDPLILLLLGHLGVGLERLGNDPPDTPARVQTRIRVLKDHLQTLAQTFAFRAIECGNRLTVDLNLSARQGV